MPKHHILRVVLQSRPVILYRTVELILTDTRQPPYLISAYDKRIALDGQIAIRFRPLEVVQIDFGQRTEEIRLV